MPQPQTRDKSRNGCPTGYPNSRSCIYYRYDDCSPASRRNPAARAGSAASGRAAFLAARLPRKSSGLRFSAPLPPLELRSAPAPFWPDVFVTRPLPWNRFLQSGVGHVIVLVLLIALTRFFALQPQVVARPSFDRLQSGLYQATEYLPPLDTRSAHAARRRKADRSLSQPASSEQDSSDSRSFLFLAKPTTTPRPSSTPPNVKLKRDVALPNIVDWSDQMQKPRLAIPPVPLTLAADTARIAPHLESSVVTPPPDAVHVAHRRNSTALETSVVAPPPSVETASTRVVGDLNMGRSSVIAPAPQLAVAEQRSSISISILRRRPQLLRKPFLRRRRVSPRDLPGSLLEDAAG